MQPAAELCQPPLTGVDLLVAQLLYSKGPGGSPNTPAPASGDPVEAGLAVPQLDSLLLEQAWGSAHVPGCAVPSERPSVCPTPALVLHPATSAGCPWACSFCFWLLFLPRVAAVHCAVKPWAQACSLQG